MRGWTRPTFFKVANPPGPAAPPERAISASVPENPEAGTGGHRACMARRLAVLLVLSLVTVTVPTTGIGQPTPTETSALVTVDADAGERVSDPAPSGTTMTVEVESVPPNASGFDLIGPDGPLFLNQSSRHDGVVTFWDVPARPGGYTVNRSLPATNRTIADDLELVDAPTVPLSEDCVQTYQRSYDCGSGCDAASGKKKVDEAIRWTPILLVNSPSTGEATASSSWSDTRSVYVANGGGESSTHSEAKIEAEGGESRGLFRLAKWGFYKRTHSACAAGYPAETTASVIDWAPHGYVKDVTRDLTGHSEHTDADNLERVEIDGERSFRFDIRYHEKDREHRGGATYTNAEERIIAFDGRISTESYRVTFDVIRFRVADGESDSYTYTFRYGETWVDEVHGGPGWAFCRPAYEDC